MVIFLSSPATCDGEDWVSGGLNREREEGGWVACLVVGHCVRHGEGVVEVTRRKLVEGVAGVVARE